MVDAIGLVQKRMMELASCQFVLGYNGVNTPPIQHAQQYQGWFLLAMTSHVFFISFYVSSFWWNSCIAQKQASGKRGCIGLLVRILHCLHYPVRSSVAYHLRYFGLSCFVRLQHAPRKEDVSAKQIICYHLCPRFLYVVWVDPTCLYHLHFKRPLFFACWKFSRNSAYFHQAGADVKENLKNWAKAQEAELAEERRASHLGWSLAAVNWCFQEVVAFLMPMIFCLRLFFLCSGNFRWRCFEICRFITYIYIYICIVSFKYIYILRFVEDAMGYSFVDISHLFSVHVWAAHDTLSTTICIWDVYYIHNLRGIYIFIYLCLYPSLVKAHWEPRCKNSILCTGGFPQDSMEPVENNIYSIPGIGSRWLIPNL